MFPNITWNPPNENSILPADYIFGNALFERYANKSTPVDEIHKDVSSLMRFIIMFAVFITNSLLFYITPIEIDRCLSFRTHKHFFHFSILSFVLAIASCFLYVVHLIEPQWDLDWSVSRIIIFEQGFEWFGYFLYCQTKVHVQLFEQHVRLLEPRNDFSITKSLFLKVVVLFFLSSFIQYYVFRIRSFITIRIFVVILPSILTVKNLIILLKNVRDEASNITTTGTLTRYGGVHFLIGSLLDFMARFFLVIRMVEDNLFYIDFDSNGSVIRSVLDYGLKLAVLNSLLAMIYLPLIHFNSFKSFRKEFLAFFQKRWGPVLKCCNQSQTNEPTVRFQA